MSILSDILAPRNSYNAGDIAGYQLLTAGTSGYMPSIPISTITTPSYLKIMEQKQNEALVNMSPEQYYKTYVEPATPLAKASQPSFLSGLGSGLGSTMGILIIGGIIYLLFIKR